MNSKTNIFFFSFLIPLCMMSVTVIAQKQYLSTKDSDNEAVKLFNKAKLLINKAATVSVEYKMTTYFPDSKPAVINGLAKQKGKMFFIESGDKSFYCDGASLVVWNRTQNIAQINDMDEKSGLMAPENILKSYDEKKYIFVLGQTVSSNKKTLQQMTLKPVEKRSEYSKIEFLIDKKSGFPDEIKMFMKDGSKTFLKINSVKMNQNLGNSVFIFNKAEHPGVSVEDLRMD
jgi:outer membrane lipoprotein-sorting protein